jgi:hypothetical protein
MFKMNLYQVEITFKNNGHTATSALVEIGNASRLVDNFITVRFDCPSGVIELLLRSVSHVSAIKKMDMSLSTM